MNKTYADRQTRERAGDKPRKHRRVSNVPGSTPYRQATETTYAACLDDLLDDEWRVVATCGRRLYDDWLYLINEKQYRGAVRTGIIVTVTRHDLDRIVVLAKLAARRVA